MSNVEPFSLRSKDPEFSNSYEVFMSNIAERVKKIISEQLDIEEQKIIPSANFIEDLGADSLDTVELVMALEEEFETEIPDEDAEKIKTVQDAIDYITGNKE